MVISAIKVRKSRPLNYIRVFECGFMPQAIDVIFILRTFHEFSLIMYTHCWLPLKKWLYQCSLHNTMSIGNGWTTWGELMEIVRSLIWYPPILKVVWDKWRYGVQLCVIERFEPWPWLDTMVHYDIIEQVCEGDILVYTRERKRPMSICYCVMHERGAITNGYKHMW